MPMPQTVKGPQLLIQFTIYLSMATDKELISIEFTDLIRKSKNSPQSIAPSDLQPHYRNGVFGYIYLLALDNTKQ